MSTEKCVSVVVPVYNTKENLLRKCFESIMVQNFRDFEVIVVDDGSSKEIATICDEYAKRDFRFTVMHTQNEGVSTARNIGIIKSKGKYIVFIDSDDYIDSDYIGILVKEVECSNADCVVCGCKHIYANIKNTTLDRVNYRKKVVNRNDIIDSLLYMKPPYKCIEITACWGKIYKRELISDISFNHNIMIGEDYVFNYLYFKKAEKVVCIDLDIYDYLIHKQSVMNSKYNSKMLNSIFEFEKMIRSESDIQKKKGVITRSLNIAMVILIMMDIKRDPVEDYKTICKFIAKYRRAVFFDSKAKIKIKIAILLTYINFSIINKLMNRSW